MSVKLSQIIGSALLLLIILFASEALSLENKHVLVLHSYNKGLTWTDNEDNGIRSVFQSHPSDIELLTEYLDSKTAADPEYFRKFYELLKYKYAAVRFNAVIATDDDAYNFYLQYRESLFPEAPVIFCGVNYYNDSQRKGLEDVITGVIESFDVSNTLKTILSLQPDTARVIIINDKSTTGIANKKIIGEVLPEFQDRIKFVYFEDLSMKELLEKVGLLGKQDVILLMTFNKDRNGQRFNYDQSIALISAASNVSIYGVWDFYLYKGIVGGMLTSGFDQGRTAAEMTLSYLGGARISDIPVVRVSPNKFMFDHNMLQRFNLDESSLPQGSLIVNQPFSFYEKHKELVLSTVAGFAGLSIIIVLLLAVIKQRKIAEAALRDSEARFRLLVEQSPIGIVIVRNQQVIYANTKYALMYGYESADEVVSLNLKSMVEPGSWNHFQESIANHLSGLQDEVVFEGFGCRKNGTSFIAMVTASRINLADGSASIGFVQDISNRKQDELEISRLNDELVRNEKLAILGQLSGSVSHELRNPLGVINNAVYLLRITLKDADVTTREYLNVIKQEIDNSLRIITDLLDFARRKPAQPQNVHIGELINSSLGKCIIPEHVEVKTAITGSLQMLRVDPQQMEQVFQNLITNGIQAMPEGGVLTIMARPFRNFNIKVRENKEKNDRSGIPEIEPVTDFAEICISDSGCGIAEEHMHKLFQPLFTTKSRGIGLGLVVCKNLVDANRGSIKVKSELGRGTTFRVLLPLEVSSLELEENF